MNIYANRGKSFELLIKMVNTSYRNKGEALIEKQNVEMLPIRNGKGQVISCKIGEKSTVDYIGRVGKYPIAIEAKHTGGKSIRFDEVKDHQARYLEEFKSSGISMVFLSFNMEQFFMVPALFWVMARGFWLAAKQKGSKRIPVTTLQAYGQEWTIPQKASVTPKDLLPEWRVENPLDYLHGIEKYMPQ